MPRPIASFIERFGGWVLFSLGLWLVVAYLALPMWWKRYETRHPALDNAPHRTQTGARIPGDPLNISLIGAPGDVVESMAAAGWYPADRLGVRSSLHIAESTVLHLPYREAPVSNLFLFGRKEDLAFEKPAGRDPRERHHVRFWQAPGLDAQGRPLWMGAVTFDRSVGFSHTTGQITHHIAAEIDAERDGLVADLQRAEKVASLNWENDFQPVGEGRNGGGDHWQTDRRMAVVLLRPAAAH